MKFCGTYATCKYPVHVGRMSFSQNLQSQVFHKSVRTVMWMIMRHDVFDDAKICDANDHASVLLNNSRIDTRLLQA
jgi:hypothetical protein